MSSRRKYVTIAEVEEYADVTSTNDPEFEDQISQAEELIDAFVGYQPKAVERVVQGLATSATSDTIVDASSDSPLDDFDDDYFTYCVVAIIAGTGAGQERAVSASSRSASSLTVGTAWSPTPDATSVYKVYQLGKFPRVQDVWRDQDNLKYYRSIPQAVRQATAAQVAYIIEMGAAFFAGADSDMSSETIGNYSYSQGSGSGGQTAIIRLVAPKARTLLRGITNRGGRLVAENPTWL